MLLKMNLAVFLAMFVAMFTFFTSVQLVCFLSFHRTLFLNHYKTDYFNSTGLCVIWNMSLVLLFAAQHSLQKKLKSFLESYEGQVFERILYNIGSCITLQILMIFWQPIDWWTMWHVPSNFKWLFTSMHVFAWAIIYGGCFMMDFSELLGVKQVYYAVQELPDPLSMKSDELRRFYSHMRHPGISAFIVILLFQPVMHLDRFLLALSLLGYIVLTSKVDSADYAYQVRLRRRKERDLDQFTYCAMNSDRVH